MDQELKMKGLTDLCSVAVASVRSLRVVLQGWGPRFSHSHGGPLIQTSREVVFVTVYCHAQVLESDVTYPAVMLWDSHILTCGTLPYLSCSLWSRQNESGSSGSECFHTYPSEMTLSYVEKCYHLTVCILKASEFVALQMVVLAVNPCL